MIIKKSHEVYLMEGFMGVNNAYRAGVENAVASMNSSGADIQHLRNVIKAVTYNDEDWSGCDGQSFKKTTGYVGEIVSFHDMDPGRIYY